MLLVPDYPTDLGFDERYSEWREYQKESIEQLVAALDTNKTVLLLAPTGSGKTITGAGLSRVLGGKAMYLSSTKQLQYQQLNTLPEAVTVTGRANHQCLLPTVLGKSITADEADCPCQHANPDGCSYYQQWFNAMRSQDVVLNYAYMVRVVKARGVRVAEGFGTTGPGMNVIANPFVGRRLMVCDEGHTLEQALIDADKVEVSERTFDRYNFSVPRSLDYADWLVWAKQAFPEVETLYETARQAQILARIEGKLDPEQHKEATRLNSMLTTLNGIIGLNNLGPSTPVHIGRTQYGSKIQPLWVWNRANDLLFKHSESAVIMSATLGSPGLTARLLGLDKGSWTQIEVPSTFPVSNRPVYYWPVSKVSARATQEDYQRQAVALVHLAGKFPNSPGVVHCNSYKLAGILMQALKSLGPDAEDTMRRVLVHNSGNKEQVFDYFEKAHDNEILITPSATTGIDWDFVGWQMIPKVPFPDMGDDIVRLRMDYVTEEGEQIGKRAYQEEAAKTLVQASGRNVRTKESKGVTVITDSSFWPLYKHIAPDAFPQWFKDAVKWYEPGKRF